MPDTPRAKLVPPYQPFECRTVTYFAGGKKVQVVRKGDGLVMATFDYATEEGNAYRHCRLLNVIYAAGYRDCASTTEPTPVGEWKRGWIGRDICDGCAVLRLNEDDAQHNDTPIDYRIVGEKAAGRDEPKSVVRWMWEDGDGLCRQTHTTREACVEAAKDTYRMLGLSDEMIEGRPVRVRLTVEPVEEVR